MKGKLCSSPFCTHGTEHDEVFNVGCPLSLDGNASAVMCAAMCAAHPAKHNNLSQEFIYLMKSLGDLYNSIDKCETFMRFDFMPDSSRGNHGAILFILSFKALSTVSHCPHIGNVPIKHLYDDYSVILLI